jgi:hypothetical protein
VDRLASVKDLEGVVGSRPLGVLLKSIDALDEHCVKLLARSLAPCAALAAADLWRAPNADLSDLPRMAQVWTDHVKRSKQRGLAATAMRKLANARVLGAAIDRDYETNLY